MQQVAQKESHKALQTIYLEEKANISVIYYVLNEWKHLDVDSFFFRFYLLLSYCFFLLSAFLSSKSFRYNQIHCEIIDRYFNVFFVEIQLKKDNLKCFLGARVVCPNRYTRLPNSLIRRWLRHKL